MARGSGLSASTGARASSSDTQSVIATIFRFRSFTFQNTPMTIRRDLRHIILYGFLLAALVLILKWVQWKFLIVDNAIDIYIGLIALFFTGLGIWGATQLYNPKTETVIVEKEIFITPSQFSVDENQLRELG